MSRIKFIHEYDDIISIENLLEAWKEFVKGKKKRKDIQIFQLRLMDNIIDLHLELKNKTYVHGGYYSFNISDPKPRNIHKASVRDRILHRAIYRKLYPFFDRIFIPDSFSCRIDKGTHKALRRFKDFSYKVSKNHTKTCWVLKCDIRKFFASIDQEILMKILNNNIEDKSILALLKNIIESFNSGIPSKGLPLGNLTSQLLVNVYMNIFDQFMKHEIKVKYYIRYADDFVILHRDKDFLIKLIPVISHFLDVRLKLALHPNKVSIETFSSGIDFLGWVHFPNHRILRTSTKKRMFRNLKIKKCKKETTQSYLGLLKHGNTYKLRKYISLLQKSSI